MNLLPAPSNHYLRLALVTLLIVGCVAVLMPFVGTLLLAIVVCIAAWPLYVRLLPLMGGRRGLTALCMALALTLLLLLPMGVLSGSLVTGVELAVQQLRPLVEQGLPDAPPEWLSRRPLIGQMVTDYWHRLSASREEVNNLLRQFFAPARQLLLTSVSIFVQGLLQLLLVVFFVFFIFRDGHTYIEALRTAARKLGGQFGERMLVLTQNTVTGVMVGIVGTAAAQALVGLVGYLIAGLPAVLMLSFATFLFSMVPVIGPTLIWGGAALWLYAQDQTGWAVFMALWGVFGISSVDNFVKPILISRTAALPLVLIVVGVFGGIAVFGFVGLFLGPTLLALGQALLREWMAEPKTEAHGND